MLTNCICTPLSVTLRFKLRSLTPEALAKFGLIAFWRFHQSLPFDLNTLLLGVCEFRSNDKS